MDNLNIPILNSGFRRVGMMMQEEYDDAKIVEDLSSGFPTFSLSLRKKDCEDVNKIENNSYCKIEDELFSLLSVDYEDEEVKEMTFEHWCVPFLQSDANEIEEPENEEDISYYLTSTLQNAPIILGNIEVGAKKKLAFNTQKVAARLQELYEEFEVEPVFRTEYHEFEKDRPMHIILDLVIRRGSKEPIILDSETNLIKASYKSDKGDLITAIEVKPYIKEETVKKTVKTAQQSVEVEVEPGSASKTKKQLEYFPTQVGGRYSQGSARNQFKDSRGNIIRQAVADCSSITHKALEYAGIDVGWNGSGWFYSTRDFRRLANEGKYFEVLGRWNDQSVWSKIEPGDLILINSPAHIVTWIGEGGNRDIFHAYGPPHAYTANWYRNNYETVMRPKNRGAARARKTRTEKVDSTLIGGSNKDQIWVHLKNIGFTDVGAAAIMGNLYQESKYDPRAIQPGGPGRGLAQWSVGDRWQDLIKFASAEGLDPWSIEAQTKFIHREMRYGYWSTRMNSRASRYGGRSGSHGYEAFNSVTDLTRATQFFCREYEVAGVEAMSIRVNEAKKIYKDYRGTYESGEDSSVTVGDTKYTTKEVSEKRLVTYSIKDIDYDDGNFYSHLGDEIIVSRDAQDLYGFNRQNKSDYLLGIHEMGSSNTAAQFETALTTLKNRSQPFEEYYIDIGTTDPETREALKNAQLGDEVWTTSHGWDRERDLVIHARISEVTRLPNQKDNIRVKLTDAERIEVVFPPGMVASQDRIRQARPDDLDRMVVSLRSDVVNFIGSKEETEIKANIRTGQTDLTNVIPDHEYRWQVYDKRGLPISETDEHDIIVGVGVNNSEGNAEWRTSELVTGRRYRIHPTIIGTEFKFHIYDDRGVLAEESDWFDDSEDVVYTASAVASYMVIETTSNVNTRSIQVFTEAVPLILEGKKVFIDADMVDERITVTCRVRDAEGSISLSKTDFTPVGETPPADFRPGSEFLRPVPDTGVYDENGNWTGKFEKEMFDGLDWVSQDVPSLNYKMSNQFSEFDRKLTERDERVNSILSGLGVDDLEETSQGILNYIQENIKGKIETSEGILTQTITGPDGKPTTFANAVQSNANFSRNTFVALQENPAAIGGDYLDTFNSAELFRQTMGSTESDVITNISQIVQSPDIIQKIVAEIDISPYPGIIGSPMYEDKDGAYKTFPGRLSGGLVSYDLSGSIVDGRMYYIQVTSTIQPYLFGVTDSSLETRQGEKIRPLTKVAGTTNTYEMSFVSTTSTLSRLYLYNDTTATGSIRLDLMYEIEPTASKTVVTQLKDSYSIETQNIANETLASIGLIGSDGYIKGDRLMIEADTHIAPGFKLTADHITGNIIELIQASFIAENGEVFISPHQITIKNKTINYTMDLNYGRLAFKNSSGQEFSRLGIFSMDGGSTYTNALFQSRSGMVGFAGSLSNGNTVGGFRVDKDGNSIFDGKVLHGIRFQGSGGRESGLIATVDGDEGHLLMQKIREINFRGGHRINSNPTHPNLNLIPNSSRNISAWGNINMNGYSVQNQSDMRLKKNIKPTKRKGIEWTKRQKVIDFTWDKDMKANKIMPEGEQFGIIAQNAGPVAKTTDDYNHYLAIKTEEVAYMNLLTNQELIKRVEELERKLENE